MVNGETLLADVVVIALGPWSGIAANLFPGSGLPKITGTRAHSIVMDVKVKWFIVLSSMHRMHKN